MVAGAVVLRSGGQPRSSAKATVTAGAMDSTDHGLDSGDASTGSGALGSGSVGPNAGGIPGTGTTNGPTNPAGPGGKGVSGPNTTTTTPVAGDGASLSLAMVRPGGTVRFRATGFRPGSKVRVELHSDPILLATPIAAPDGGVATDLTIPASVPTGGHHVVASGNDPNGAVLTRSVPLVIGNDTTPPELRDFSFTPNTLDTSTVPQIVTVRAHLVDAGVGVAGEGYTHGASEVRFASPSGGQIAGSAIYKVVSGDLSDGVFEATFALPAGSEHGTWTLQYLWLIDGVGNRATFNAAALAADGFPTTITQLGTGDTTPPVLRDLALTPTSVDTSGGARTITVRAHMADAGVGVAGEGYTHGASEIRFISPSGNQMADAAIYKLISGDASDGVYEGTFTVPAGAEPGTWALQFFWLIDKVGNRASLDAAALRANGYPTAFEQVGAGDTAAPTLRDFSFTPASVDTSTGAQTITIRAHMADAGVGVAGEGYTHGASEIRFLSPSGNQMADAAVYKLISGDPSDGVYQATMTVPAGAEAGTWTLQFFWLIDQVGNRASLDANALIAAGFPVTFEVVRPN